MPILSCQDGISANRVGKGCAQMTLEVVSRSPYTHHWLDPKGSAKNNALAMVVQVKLQQNCFLM